MLASELISIDYPFLSSSDTIDKAIDIFLDTCYCHIPIVEEGKLCGILPTDILMTSTNRDVPVTEYKDDWINAFIYSDQHGLEVLEIAGRNELNVLPVIDEEKNYQGAIYIQDLLYRLSSYYALKQLGGIIELTFGTRDYDLSEISRIIGSNNARILMLYLNHEEATDQLKLTIKVDKLNLNHILATFERFNYNVSFYYPSKGDTDELKERYDLLMKLFDL